MNARQAILCEIMGVVATLACLNTASAAVIISDSIFNDSDWDLTVTYEGQGANSIAYQVISGGNPGGYRRIVNSVYPLSPPYCQANSYSRRLGMSYSPQMQGAIASLDYSEDALNETNWGQGSCTAPVIFQNGVIYPGPGSNTPDGTWTRHSLWNLTANDFSDGTGHPDFTATAPPLEFGFLRANSMPYYPGGGGYTMLTGIDNWTFTITPVPEPAAFPLLVLGVLTVVRGRR